MTHIATERSIHDGDIRELYTFVLASGTYYLTSHDEDITYGGITYIATEGLSRGNITMAALTRTRETTVTLPITHEVALALLPIPSRNATLTITRIHAGATNVSADRRQSWYGPIAGVDVEGDDEPLALLRVPNALDVAFDVTLPILRISRTCQHQLYSVGCTVLPSGANKKETTVAAVSGVVITCTSLAGYADQVATHGYVQRVADGEKRSILDQTGNVIVIDVPFATLNELDEIEVFKGCDKLFETCRGKFLNGDNFGGHPHVPDNNPASPTGKGLL